ncbi:hypothetical protein [Marinospirillum insulare]|uniref:Uncharacterized protein n=1 Tax=Marinospirillum insulare TaxID=217169 RepID=A0ABQ5ZXH1_9GAMM|nr:hypothetical protein [Marinospirillum insulare]GLR62645.1 hypothetical protein GCM10007878_00800 [Marinospirillum insulare]
MRLVFFILIVVFSKQSYALEISSNGGVFIMDGIIEEGDAKKVALLFSNLDEPPNMFLISSYGGNIQEAIKIGRFIRLSNVPVWTDKQCYSACVFIWAAGVDRIAIGEIGLHRPRYEHGYFSSLSLYEAQKKYVQLTKDSVEYLKEIEVPDKVIERIFKAPSNEVDLLTAVEANEEFGVRSAFYDEWLIAKCGAYNPEQLIIVNSYHSLELARILNPNVNDEDISLEDDAKLAFNMEQKGLLAPYIKMIKDMDECRNNAVKEQVTKFHRGVKTKLKEMGMQ